jgi:hypothetical protein
MLSPPGKGAYSFRIHGKIYHLVSALYPNEANKRGYEQIYSSNLLKEKKKMLKTNETKNVLLK